MHLYGMHSAAAPERCNTPPAQTRDSRLESDYYSISLQAPQREQP